MSFSEDSDDEGDVPPLLDAPPPGMPAAPPPPPPKKATPPTTAAAGSVPKPPAAPAAKRAAPSELLPRSKVRLHGLSGRAELNGCTGEVVGPPTENGRIPVRLGAPHNQNLALKAANLELVGVPPSAAPSVKAASKPASDADGLTVVRKAEGADPLRLPAVQKSMEEQQANASAASVGGGAPSWVTPDLLTKIAADPLLRKAFTDPKCAGAMAALQTDPQKAMQQYGDVPEMREFIVAFMKLMGDHFTALGEAQGPAVAAGPPVQPVVPLSPEEEAVRKAMADPEVAAILKEPAIQEILQKLQVGRAHEVERAMSQPEMIRKLQKLSQAGLINMHWER